MTLPTVYTTSGAYAKGMPNNKPPLKVGGSGEPNRQDAYHGHAVGAGG